MRSNAVTGLDILGEDGSEALNGVSSFQVWDVLDTAAVARRFSTLGPQKVKRERPAEPAEVEED